MEAFDALVKQGKVRALGASNYTAARLGKALEVSRQLGLARFESLQPHYNLVERDEFEGDLENLCLSDNVGGDQLLQPRQRIFKRQVSCGWRSRK